MDASMKFTKHLFTTTLLLICLFSRSCRSASISEAVKITEENWKDVLTGDWMVEFMAPWCPACRAFTKTWQNLAGWSESLDINVAVVDVTENPGLSGRFLVTSLPTIYHVTDGQFRVYQGSRGVDDLVKFIDDKRYDELQPVSWWVHPNSIQMSTVSMFFKISMHVRSFYNMMVEVYGIPEWGCYIIFAVATIVIGLLLGLVLVMCCDMIFPPKYGVQRPVSPRPPVDRPDANNQQDGDGIRDDESDILDDTRSADGDSTTRRRKTKQENDAE